MSKLKLEHFCKNAMLESSYRSFASVLQCVLKESIEDPDTNDQCAQTSNPTGIGDTARFFTVLPDAGREYSDRSLYMLPYGMQWISFDDIREQWCSNSFLTTVAMMFFSWEWKWSSDVNY